MTAPRALLESLEHAAESGADPASDVYRRLFARYPDFESMFEMDRDGGVRGAMLQHALDCLIHQAEGNATGANFFAAERNTHDGYGIPPDRFGTFYEVIRDTFRDLLGARWTDETAAAWDEAIRGLTGPAR